MSRLILYGRSVVLRCLTPTSLTTIRASQLMAFHFIFNVFNISASLSTASKHSLDACTSIFYMFSLNTTNSHCLLYVHSLQYVVYVQCLQYSHCLQYLHCLLYHLDHTVIEEIVRQTTQYLRSRLFTKFKIFTLSTMFTLFILFSLLTLLELFTFVGLLFPMFTLFIIFTQGHLVG